MIAKYAPRPKLAAVHVYPDKREVCDLKTAEGKREYHRRKLEMAARQDEICPSVRNSWLARHSIMRQEEVWQQLGATTRFYTKTADGEMLLSAMGAMGTKEVGTFIGSVLSIYQFCNRRGGGKWQRTIRFAERRHGCFKCASVAAMKHGQ